MKMLNHGWTQIRADNELGGTGVSPMCFDSNGRDAHAAIEPVTERGCKRFQWNVFANRWKSRLLESFYIRNKNMETGRMPVLRFTIHLRNSLVSAIK
jgi:hypothetical protein